MQIFIEQLHSGVKLNDHLEKKSSRPLLSLIVLSQFQYAPSLQQQEFYIHLLSLILTNSKSWHTFWRTNSRLLPLYLQMQDLTTTISSADNFLKYGFLSNPAKIAKNRSNCPVTLKRNIELPHCFQNYY